MKKLNCWRPCAAAVGAMAFFAPSAIKAGESKGLVHVSVEVVASCKIDTSGGTTDLRYSPGSKPVIISEPIFPPTGSAGVIDDFRLVRIEF